MNKKLVILVGIVCAAVFAFAACSPSPETASAPPATAVEGSTQESTITVSSTESVKASPDIAYINMGVQTVASSAQEAQQQNAKASESFLNAIKGQGVADADIETSGINMYPSYDNPNQYTIDNNFRLTIRDLKKLGAIIDAGIGAGANTAYSLTFDVSERNAQYVEALKLAMKSVGQKATALAESGGYKITRTLSIQEAGSSNFMPMEQSADAMLAGGQTPVMPSEIEISATVSGTYVIS